MDGCPLARNIPCPLPIPKSDKDGELTDSYLTDSYLDKGSSVCGNELCCYLDNNGDDNKAYKLEQSYKILSLREEIASFLIFTGRESLCIYLIHGLLLNLLKTDTPISFLSIAGIALTFANYILSVSLCAIIIHILGKNKTLCRILGIKGNISE